MRIFYRECHPSVYKGATGSKEGLSLFGKRKGSSVVLVKKFYFSFSYNKVTETSNVLVIVYTVIPV